VWRSNGGRQKKGQALTERNLTMAKKRESLIVASKVKAYVSQIDGGIAVTQRDIQTLDRRFPGDGQVQRAASLGLQDLARADRTLKNVVGAVEWLRRYLASVQRGG
jgi:hypothetical protein